MSTGQGWCDGGVGVPIVRRGEQRCAGCAESVRFRSDGDSQAREPEEYCTSCTGRSEAPSRTAPRHCSGRRRASGKRPTRTREREGVPDVVAR